MKRQVNVSGKSAKGAQKGQPKGNPAPQRSYGRPARNPRNRGGPGLKPPYSIGREVGDGAMSEAPVAQARVYRQGAPRMITQRNGDCRIIHREYIQDIVAQSTSPSTFTDQVLPINPGQAGTFPWLSNVAARFESYHFNRLKFDYETEAPSSLGGTLVLGIDYDAADPAAISKQQALAWRGSVRSAPWKPCCHTSSQEDLSKLKSHYVRPGLVPAGADVKTYDVGNLNIISQGVTTGSAVLGELYVEYDITLMTPVYENTASTSGTMTTASGTIASPLLNGVALGSLPITQALTVATVSNLVIGQEYQVSYAGTGTSPVSLGSPVGWTLKTTVATGGSTGAAISTYVATATIASIAITTAAGTQILFTVSQIPTSAY